jgi:hypothetical protein
MALAAGSLAMLGTAAAWVRWAWRRSSVHPLPGGLVSIGAGGKSVVVDPVRGLVGGVLAIDAKGAPRPILATSEDLAADVARAALVADAVKHVGGSESRAELAAKVTESLGAAFANLTSAAASTRPAMVATGAPALRLVRYHTSTEKKAVAVANETAELKEFVEVGADIGYQRDRWTHGYKFKSTGRACSQTRWGQLHGALQEVRLLDGSQLVCSTAEALERLGFKGEPAGAGEE